MRPCSRVGILDGQVTLDAPDEDVARIICPENPKMRVEAVTIHFYMEAAPIALRTNLYLCALDLRSHRENRIVSDQGGSFRRAPSLPLLHAEFD